MNSTKFSSKNYLDVESILKKKKIRKADLATSLGVPRQSINSYLNGNVTLEKIVKIADALEVEVWQLFSSSENVLNGFVEYKGEIYRIQNRDDLKKLMERTNID